MDFRQKTTFAACAALMVGLVFSPFLLSLSMWVLAYAALIDARRRIDLRGALGRYFSKPSHWALALLPLLTAASALWSDDLRYCLERAQVRLPFIVVPFALAGLAPFSKRQFEGLLWFFLMLMSAVAAGVLIHFLLHFDETMAELSRGGSLAAPRSHIRFSLLIALATAVGWHLFEQNRGQRQGRAALVLSAFLFVFAHVLAVRSGLAALYAISIFWAGRLIFIKKQWFVGVFVLVCLAFGPLAAIRFLPSLKAKIGYTIWDWTQGRNDLSASYSDSDRFVSLASGWQLFKENPLLGVGSGDLPAEMQRVAQTRWPDRRQAVKLPHNQILYVMAATGLVGLAVSLFAWSAPLLFGEKKQRRDSLMISALIVLFVSFMVEYTIEGTFGAVLAAFFPLFFWHERRGSPQRLGGEAVFR